MRRSTRGSRGVVLAALVACSSADGDDPADAGLGDASPADGGGGDAGPGPEVVVDQLGAPFAVAVAGDELFFSDAADSTIKRCQIASCAATQTVFATGQVVHTDQLRVRDGFVYWSSPGGVFRCPLAACPAPEELASTGDASALLVDDAGLFIARKTARLLALVPWGGGSTTIATGVFDLRGLAVRDGFVYFPTYGLPPDESHVYRCAIAGCGDAPTRLDGTSVGIGAAGVATSATDVYWAEASFVKRCPLAGCDGASAELLESTLTYSSVTLVGDWLYIGAQGSQVFTVCQAAACAATRRELLLGSAFQASDHDASAFYVVASSSPGDGRILRIPLAP